MGAEVALVHESAESSSVGIGDRTARALQNSRTHLDRCVGPAFRNLVRMEQVATHSASKSSDEPPSPIPPPCLKVVHEGQCRSGQGHHDLRDTVARFWIRMLAPSDEVRPHHESTPDHQAERQNPGRHDNSPRTFPIPG